jgi:enoyl-CoA hydratase/carnithine racemase
MDEELLYEVRNGAAWMTLNRESRRNALSREMLSAFLEFIDRAGEDAEVQAVCITGAGEKAFCAGADLAASLGNGNADSLSGATSYAELLKKLARFGKPVVARVNGPCLAGGMGLMLSCDIVLARDDAYFCTPEVNVGIFPMMIGALLYRNGLKKKILEMVLTGRRIPASEGEKIGLITRAVAPSQLDQEVQTTLDSLISKSPIGIRTGKEAFYAMSEMPFEEAVDYLCDALRKIIATEDAKEGMLAFLEKRKPDFKGK